MGQHALKIDALANLVVGANLKAQYIITVDQCMSPHMECGPAKDWASLIQLENTGAHGQSVTQHITTI
jgi:hypothetical protein